MLKLLPKAKENLKKIIEAGSCRYEDGISCDCCALLGFDCDAVHGDVAEKARELLAMFEEEKDGKQ